MKTKRIRKWAWIIFSIALLVQTLYDPISPLLHLGRNIKARIDLPLARSRWDAQRPSHYAFEGGNGLGGLCMANAKVEVRDEKVVQVYLKKFPLEDLDEDAVSTTPLPPSEWANPNFPDSFFCDYANFTITRLFDQVENNIQIISMLNFDKKYGFVSNVRFGTPDAHGLLNPMIGGCCTYFRVEKFQVLDE